MLHQSARAGNTGNAKKYLIGAGNAKAGIDAIDKSVIIKRWYSSRLCALIVDAVDQLANLVLQGGHQLRVGVAQRVDGNAAQAVQVFLAVHVPHSAASAM